MPPPYSSRVGHGLKQRVATKTRLKFIHTLSGIAFALEYDWNDHRLPFVYLRERRRELVMTMTSATITIDLLNEVAAIQQTIKAVEAVIAD